MFAQLQSILAFCTLVLAAFGLGRPILRGLGVGQEDRLSVGVWSIGLGLIAWGTLLLGLGLLGGLYVAVIAAGSMAACFWGLGEILRGRLRKAEQRAPRPEDAPWAPPARWLSRGEFMEW